MYFRKKHVLTILLFSMVLGNSLAQNYNRTADSVRITMTTPFDAGVKWNCICVIHDNLVSVNIKESCRQIEIPRKNIVMPDKVIYRFFELSDKQDVLFKDCKSLHRALSALAFDILEHRETIRKEIIEEIESDTVWTVSIFKEGNIIDSISVGNHSRSDNSCQLTRLSGIMEQLVCIGRFYIGSLGADFCSN